MIVSKDINPERDVYYLGAKVIEILSNKNNPSINYIDVFEELKLSEDVSITLFILVLDWLYLSGAISKIEKGRIVKCF